MVSAERLAGWCSQGPSLSRLCSRRPGNYQAALSKHLWIAGCFSRLIYAEEQNPVQEVFSSSEMPGWYFAHAVTLAGFRAAPPWMWGWIHMEEGVVASSNVAGVTCLSLCFCSDRSSDSKTTCETKENMCTSLRGWFIVWAAFTLMLFEKEQLTGRLDWEVEIRCLWLKHWALRVFLPFYFRPSIQLRLGLWSRKNIILMHRWASVPHLWSLSEVPVLHPISVLSEHQQMFYLLPFMYMMRFFIWWSQLIKPCSTALSYIKAGWILMLLALSSDVKLAEAVGNRLKLE